MLANMPFNLTTDFRPVARLSASYNVLVVNPSVPANSVAELVALIRSQPDKLSFSSGGAGTPAHLVGELFKLQNGLRATHVPYPTNFSNAIGDLLNGTNQYMFITTLPVIDLIAAGKLRALAVTAPKRIAMLKDAHGGGAGLSKPGRRGLDRARGCERDARRRRRKAQHRHQQGARDAEGQGCVRQDRRRAGRRDAGELRRARQAAGRLLGQGREGGRYPATIAAVRAGACTTVGVMAFTFDVGASPYCGCRS
jgi:hypothetical protein